MDQVRRCCLQLQHTAAFRREHQKILSALMPFSVGWPWPILLCMPPAPVQCVPEPNSASWFCLAQGGCVYCIMVAQQPAQYMFCLKQLAGLTKGVLHGYDLGPLGRPLQPCGAPSVVFFICSDCGSWVVLTVQPFESWQSCNSFPTVQQLADSTDGIVGFQGPAPYAAQLFWCGCTCCYWNCSSFQLA